MAENKDRQMLEKCISHEAADVFKGAKCEHPLDQDIIAKLQALCSKIKRDEAGRLNPLENYSEWACATFTIGLSK